MKTTVSLCHEPNRIRPWLVRWWDPPDDDTGKQRKHARSFRYRREAAAFQATKQTELNKDTPSATRAHITLADLLQEFEAARFPTLSYSSRCGYGNTIRQLRQYFGGPRELTAIEQRHAEKFMATRTRIDGRLGKLSTWSLAHHLKHCRAIFGAAVDWGFMAANPFRPLRTRVASALAARGRSKQWHHLRPDEFVRLLDKVADVRRRAMYWLMYGSGLRPGEVFNLTADKIDLHHRRVHIENRAASDGLPPFTVKAHDRAAEGKERSVPIPAAAIPDIRAAVRLSFRAGSFIALSPERYLYIRSAWAKCRLGLAWGANKQHRPWQNRDMLNNPLRTLKSDVRRAGIETTTPVTLTTLRKSFAQNHADHGTPPRTLAKLLGHSDVRTTMEFYNRATDANERVAAAAMDSLFASEFHWKSTGNPNDDVAC